MPRRCTWTWPAFAARSSRDAAVLARLLPDCALMLRSRWPARACPHPPAEARSSSEQGGAPPAPASAAEVVAGVVGRRLDQLDATFLATLDGYIGGAGERGASEVAGALAASRLGGCCWFGRGGSTVDEKPRK